MNNMVVSKIGLVNFWLYDIEEYDFYGGNLILRGTNGSGKSVTMQSFIPLILDGNKSPDRLDPFGSKDRKIEDYIIGDSDSVQKEEATSYLYMEVYNKKDKRYITIGLGFRGRKGKGVESWGFSLKDGKRVNKDFFLYKDVVNKVPLSRNELKARLGEINEFTDSIKDYKTMVNRLLFGFPNLDIYDEFIKLLLQLRSNKLSKDYKPSNLINVLNTVLQPLSEEDLRPLSDAIEQMNNTKEKIEILERNAKSLKDFLKAYEYYNRVMLTIKARNYKQCSDNYKKIHNEYEILLNEIDSTTKDIELKKELYKEIVEKLEIAINEKKEYDNSDLNNKTESLTNLKDEIKKNDEKIVLLKGKLEDLNNRKLKVSNDLTNSSNKKYELKKRIDDIVIDLKDMGTEIYFDDLIFFIDEFNNKIDENISFASIEMLLKNYQDRVVVVYNLLIDEDKIQMNLEKEQLELNKLIKEYENYEKDLTKLDGKFNDELMYWLELFANLKNEVLVLNDEIKNEIYKIVNKTNTLNYIDSFKKIDSIYNKHGNDIKNSIMSDNLKLENKIDNYNKEIFTLNKELEELKNQNDIELNNTDINIDNILDSNNIKHISLYKCIEFKDNILDDIKNNIESSLLNLGILGAKIIDVDDIEKVKKLKTKILYLQESTYKKNNILKYLKITLPSNSLIDEKYVEKVLSSISVDNSDIVSISEDGSAKIDILNTLPDREYEQFLIGYLKRIELKNKKISILEDKIDSLRKQVNAIENIILNNKDKLAILDNEFEKLPWIINLEQLDEMIKEIKLSINWNDNNQKEIEKKLLLENDKIKEIKDKILLNKKNINIPLNLLAYKEVIEGIVSVIASFNSLEKNYTSYIAQVELNNVFTNNLDEITNDIEYNEGDLSHCEQLRKINVSKCKMLEEILNQQEYVDKKDRLLRLVEDIKQYEIDKEQYVRDVSGLEKELEHKRIDLNSKYQDVSKMEILVNIYKKIFIREYRLGYIYKDLIDSTDNAVKVILNDSRDLKDITSANSLRNFYEVYNKYKLELSDYGLRDYNIFNDYETDDMEFRKIYEENIRIDVSAMYQGIKLNVIDLYARIQSDIEDNKDLISEQDRHLFEDILLNTVGEKIRNRINSSQEWVSKINGIMAKMQENSALRFKLVWKSIQASNDGEIDTKEIVEILRKDPKVVKENDSEKLTNHFRSKIKKAEELNQDSYISFYKIIEEILDYRSWFTFKLEYQRSGDSYKELTDRTFSKFSGGERAKSMYIPLFASVYAKLNLARDDSLRLIALDEAFAGVDEENIREMFGIIKYLNINFIINSQVLWGDYDTIDDLSICELIRPNNSQVVTVERYRWNGKYKEIIENRKEYNEELENA